MPAGKIRGTLKGTGVVLAIAFSSRSRPLVLHVVFFICKGCLEDLNSPTGIRLDEGGELFLNVWTGVHSTHDRIVRRAGQDPRQLGTGSLTGADLNERASG